MERPRRRRLLAGFLALGEAMCFLQGWRSPVRSLSICLRQASQEALVTFNFDALSVPESQRQRTISSLVRQMGVAEKLQVSHENVEEYLNECLQSMPSNPYHGPAHVLDVLQFLTTLLQETGLATVLSEVQSSALVLAAAAHDVDHTGTSNALLVALRHEYLEDSEEDIGPMESHSAQRATDLIQDHLGTQDSELLRLVRRAIHGTDLAQHPKILGAFKEALETASLEAFFQVGSEESVLLLQVLLKSADVSNPTRPIGTARAWNSQVYQEFYAEGDEVLSSGGVPNPLHDRRTNCIPKSSVGFIRFHVKSIFLALKDFLTRCHDAKLLPTPEGVDPILARLDENAATFEQEAASQENVRLKA